MPRRVASRLAALARSFLSRSWLARSFLAERVRSISRGRVLGAGAACAALAGVMALGGSEERLAGAPVAAVTVPAVHSDWRDPVFDDGSDFTLRIREPSLRVHPPRPLPRPRVRRPAAMAVHDAVPAPPIVVNAPLPTVAPAAVAPAGPDLHGDALFAALPSLDGAGGVRTRRVSAPRPVDGPAPGWAAGPPEATSDPSEAAPPPVRSPVEAAPLSQEIAGAPDGGLDPVLGPEPAEPGSPAPQHPVASLLGGPDDAGDTEAGWAPPGFVPPARDALEELGVATQGQPETLPPVTTGPPEMLPPAAAEPPDALPPVATGHPETLPPVGNGPIEDTPLPVRGGGKPDSTPAPPVSVPLPSVARGVVASSPSPVPEPSTGALLGLGLVALAARRRRGA